MVIVWMNKELYEMLALNVLLGAWTDFREIGCGPTSYQNRGVAPWRMQCQYVCVHIEL